MSDTPKEPTSSTQAAPKRIKPTKETAPAPKAAPRVVQRAAFERALEQQVEREKALTHLADMVSAARRRLPMVEVENYAFAGPDGPVTLVELFGDHYLLLVQHFMFAPDWTDGCPSCSYATDSLPANAGLLDAEGVAFAMISHAPVAKLERWRKKKGWPHRWVSSGETTFHNDWGWNERDAEGHDGPIPGFSFYLLRDGVPYLTYATRGRGTEALVTPSAILDRTVYGRQQDWEDSPRGWPQYPTYG